MQVLQRSRITGFLFVLISSLSTTLVGAEERGHPLTRIYTPEETTGSTQNWSVSVATDGLVYIMNRDGILEYDGNTPIMLENTTGRWFFRSKSDDDGNIWVAGASEIGVLVPSAEGGRQFIDLSNRLPEEHREFKHVRHVLVSTEGVFFAAPTIVVRVDPGDVSATGELLDHWTNAPPSVNRAITETSKGIVRLQTPNGWQRFEAGAWLDEKDGDGFEGDNVVAVADLPDGLLVCTQDQGVFAYRNQERTILSSELQARTVDKYVTRCDRMRDNLYAVSTLSAGVTLFDEQGRVIDYFDESNGLPTNWVSDTPAIDKTGGWWLALGAGMARLAIDVPIRVLDYEDGVRNNINQISLLNDMVYLAGTTGLFQINPVEPDSNRSKVTRTTEKVTSSWGVATVGDKLLVSLRDGLMQLDPKTDESVMLTRVPMYDALILPGAKQAFVGSGGDGLFYFSIENEQLKLERQLFAGEGGARFLYRIDDEIWFRAGGGSAGKPPKVGRFKPGDMSSDPDVRYYTRADGVDFENNDVSFLVKGGKPFVRQRMSVDPSNTKYLRFNPVLDRFEPLLKDNLEHQGVDLGLRNLDQIVSYRMQRDRHPDQAAHKFFWYGSTTNHLMVTKDNGTAWLQGKGAQVAFIDFNIQMPFEHMPRVLIRGASTGERFLSVLEGTQRTLPYSSATLRVSHSLPELDQHNAIAYRTRLVGLESNWSPWNDSVYKEYSALREGNYRYEVQARDAWHRLSDVSQYEFEVLPPWHRTILAYIAYVLTAVMAIAAWTRIRTRRANRRVGVLQEEVSKRELAEQNLAITFEQVPIALAVVDLQTGIIIDCNAAFVELTEHPRNEILNKNGADLNVFVNSQQMEEMIENLRQKKPVENVGLTIRSGSGAIKSCQYSTTLAMRQERSVFLIAVRDLTEILDSRAAQYRLQSQLQHMQAIDDIASLTSGVAHDFNNLLAVIQLQAKLLIKKSDGIENVQEPADQIISASRYASNLVTQLLTFSRRADATIQEVDLNALCQEATRFLKTTVPSKHTIDYSSKVDKAITMANSTQVNQIILNLGTNAIQAMREKGHISIELFSRNVIKRTALLAGDVNPGRYHVIRVSDTGQGIDASTLGQIFEPFFTTKTSGEGTGLGLAIVAEIMRSLHGGIDVSSQLGVGTSLELYWPAVSEKVEEPAQAASIDGIYTGRGQRIMTVDDNRSITTLYAQVLNGSGFRATPCFSSEEALRILDVQLQRFNLVITDYDMPKMNGVELARKIKALRGDLPIILLSGHNPIEHGYKESEQLFAAILAKPITPQDLIEAINKAL